MRLLTAKLVSRLNRVFSHGPNAFLAMRLRHASGTFRWVVAEDRLTGYVDEAPIFDVDLSAHTVLSLVQYLSSLSGLTVSSAAPPEYRGLSARVLVPGQGRQLDQGGDALRGFTSLLWAYLDALAFELQAAEQQVRDTIAQMTLSQADEQWMEVWGEQFGVPRRAGEPLPNYARRIVIDTIRLRGNNRALEMALYDRFGQHATVEDVTLNGPTFPIYNGAILHDGAYNHVGAYNPIFGLFRVLVGYDLLGGGNPIEFVAEVAEVIEQLRHAGTHLESVRLGGSTLEDVYPGRPSDGLAVQELTADLDMVDVFVAPPVDASMLAVLALARFTGDAVAAPTEGADVTVSWATLHNGVRSYDGSAPYSSGLAVPEALS